MYIILQILQVFARQALDVILCRLEGSPWIGPLRALFVAFGCNCESAHFSHNGICSIMMWLNVLVATAAEVCSYEKIAERFGPEHTVSGNWLEACCQVPDREPLSCGVKRAASRSFMAAAPAGGSRGNMKSRS